MISLCTKLHKLCFLTPVYFFAGTFLFLALFFSIQVTHDQQFVYLAQAFLKGQLYLIQCPQDQCLDFSLVNGHYFWPLGPLPAIILMPFVFVSKFFSFFFYQYYLNFLMVILVFGLILKIARHLGYSMEDGIYWAVAFCFASPFLAIAFLPKSWYFSHTVVVLLLFLLVYEWLTKRRLWLLSLLVGLIISTRLTAGVGSLIFILAIYYPRFINENGFDNKTKILLSVTPLAVVLSILLTYNFLRFGNIFDNGYAQQITHANFVESRNAYGIYSPIYLPANFYYAFLGTPLPVFGNNLPNILKFPFLRPNVWGMSIFVTSPYLLYLFFLKYRGGVSRTLLFCCVVVAFLLFLFYGSGYLQFGYRYSLDFLPFLFFLLMSGYQEKNKGLKQGFRILILFSVLFDLYLFLFGFY